ncbi:type III secretion system ATPase SctN [Herbaspirillum sp. RTI4]|uniref:type III secretion system ATPase SctN n=1 Tax=Herbaspirillum sp. RTI4 TaxID=3048640 RepID=UPI002AB5039D|nr:type III secretion system ATPase SctN [Herbaspirillum sp. RTI4]MDY7578367.1 type III secretion system ATPase SctN [Herbaspirillum sp. RTI4]MEA9983517.1 type III secretion system ATPase SctN [Herbaspirillum sp. RTI4]
MRIPPFFCQLAHPLSINGVTIHAPLLNVFIGELCLLRRSVNDRTVVGRAQVTGLNPKGTVLTLLGHNKGLGRDIVLHPTGAALSITGSDAWMGKVIDSSGRIVDRLSNHELPEAPMCHLNINRAPVPYQLRQPLNRPLTTGIRAIDGMLTCASGQRIGIFASAGCGKTALLQMIIAHADADVFVIGLIGERGREVAEFVNILRESEKADRTVLVFATSDYASVDRCNAALIATTIAEYFRDRGQQVVLLLDSVTRYARALRDVAFSTGELPSRRGYPASVFEALPLLLERPGCTVTGSITAFYTILLEDEDESDAIGEEVKSILDGHIYLSRKLAGQGHFPAIDILNSTSRVFTHVADEAHQHTATGLRRLLARLADLKLYRDIGEYKPGLDRDNDMALEREPALENFLCQPTDECSRYDETLESMNEV